MSEQKLLAGLSGFLGPSLESEGAQPITSGLRPSREGRKDRFDSLRARPWESRKAQR